MRDIQTAGHFWHRYPCYTMLKRSHWPVETPLQTELRGPQQELERTALFAKQTGLVDQRATTRSILKEHTVSIEDVSEFSVTDYQEKAQAATFDQKMTQFRQGAIDGKVFRLNVHRV